METSSVWNNNESHFTLSSAQNDDSIHNLNSKSSFTENRKSTYPIFTLLSSRQSSPRSTNTSFVPHSYHFQSFSLTGSQTIHFLHCLSCSNLYFFLRLLNDLFLFFFLFPFYQFFFILIKACNILWKRRICFHAPHMKNTTNEYVYCTSISVQHRSFILYLCLHPFDFSFTFLLFFSFTSNEIRHLHWYPFRTHLCSSLLQNSHRKWAKMTSLTCFTLSRSLSPCLPRFLPSLYFFLNNHFIPLRFLF